MARKQTEIPDQPKGPDYSDPSQWPAKVDSYATGLELLNVLWTCDRAYSVPDLTLMAQARFELSRQRRLPSYYLDSLRKLHKRHLAREAAKSTTGEAFPVPGMPGTPLPVALTPQQQAQLDALEQESAKSAGFTVRR